MSWKYSPRFFRDLFSGELGKSFQSSWKRKMKIKHYLKALKIYFLLSIIFVFALLIVFLFGIKGVYQLFLMNEEVFSIANCIKAMTNVLLGLPGIIEALIVSLIGFFITKNFKIVYGNLMRFLR